MVKNTIMDNYATQYIGKEVEVKIDRLLNSTHPKHGFVYEVNYGFVPNTMAPDGEEVDAYILGVDAPLETYTGKCIAVIHRLSDADDKLVVVPHSFESISDDDIRKATHFQEQFFDSKIIHHP